MEDKFLIPSAVVIAGVIIAGAIVYTQLPQTARAPSDGEAGGIPLAGQAVKSDILKILKNDFILGSPTAKVIIIEYGDFQCPFCGRFFQTTEQQIKDTYVQSGKAAFIWRDFAFLGEESFRAAEAARCAGEQGKFWEYHDHIFKNQKGENEGAFADAVLKKFARDLGLDSGKFDSCFASGKYRKAVEEATKGGKDAGVSGTPANFVNGRMISGAVPFASFQKLIEEELKK